MLNENRPISQRKLESNRRNARKSTGPASAPGRAISSQNARKHTLLPFENPALPIQLTAQYYGKFIPANSKERQLVNTMIHSDRVRRYFGSLNPHASVIPYALVVAECADRNARHQLQAIRTKAA